MDGKDQQGAYVPAEERVPAPTEASWTAEAVDLESVPLPGDSLDDLPGFTF